MPMQPRFRAAARLPFRRKAMNMPRADWFEKKVTLGNIITIISLIVGMTLAFSRHETEIQLVKQAQASAEIVNIERFNSVSQDIREIKGSLKDITDRLIDNNRHDNHRR